jgi:hypothetical protein
MHACIMAAATGRISVKFHNGGLLRKSITHTHTHKIDIIGEKCRVLYIKTEVHVVVAGYITSPLKRCLRVICYQAVGRAEEV